MMERLPLRQQMFIVMLFLFSFANMLSLMLYMGFSFDGVVYVISVLLGLGLTFTVYRLLYSFSRLVYSKEFSYAKEQPPKRG